jgi:hypothetical protein
VALSPVVADAGRSLAVLDSSSKADRCANGERPKNGKDIRIKSEKILQPGGFDSSFLLPPTDQFVP